jgi:hypothetical protein
MSTKITRRKLFGFAAQATVIAGAGKFFVTSSPGMTRGPAIDAKYKNALEALDGYVKQYMREMNSPGMSMVLANRDGVLRAAAYGFGERRRRERLQKCN